MGGHQVCPALYSAGNETVTGSERSVAVTYRLHPKVEMFVGSRLEVITGLLVAPF